MQLGVATTCIPLEDLPRLDPAPFHLESVDQKLPTLLHTPEFPSLVFVSCLCWTLSRTQQLLLETHDTSVESSVLFTKQLIGPREIFYLINS